MKKTNRVVRKVYQKTMMKGASSPDFSNFQDEEVVDEVTEKNQSWS